VNEQEQNELLEILGTHLGKSADAMSRLEATQAQANDLVAQLATQVGDLTDQFSELAGALDRLAAAGRVGVRKVPRTD
jgi:predicted nuclease with TOPRIM domain